MSYCSTLQLWMGTHPKSPSHVVDSGETLSTRLTARPEYIGARVRAKFGIESGGHLPFLFKALAIGKALSIQTHPDKRTAEKLHEEYPAIYTGETQSRLVADPLQTAHELISLLIWKFEKRTRACVYVCVMGDE